MQLSLVGVDHRTAALDVREQLHLDQESTRRLLAAIRRTFPGCEAFVLSTCNRTELLFAEPDGGRASEAWHLLVRQARGGGDHDEGPQEPCGHATAHRYRYEGEDAARHVIRVAAGLDSAVLGDVEILGQIRGALALAQEAGTLGKHLHRLLRRALQAGKAVRSQTQLATGGAGIGSAVASILRSRLDDDARIVLVGAGMAARAVATQLHKHGHGRLTVVNRTRPHAAELAGAVGARAAGLDALGDVLATSDAVVVLVGGGQVVLDRRILDEVAARRAGRPLLAVDGCVPHAVEPHAGLDLVTLDAIAEQQADVRARRAAAVPAAERIVAGALAEFATWRRQARLDGVAATLFSAADRFVAEAAGRLDPDDLQALRADVRRAVHRRITALRAGVGATAEG